MNEPRSSRLDAERPTGEEHLGFLVELFGDPQVARWHWPGTSPGAGPRGAEESGRFHRRSTEHWAKHGYGWWLWRDRDRARLVARVGLVQATVEGEPVVELGWSVPVAEQGRGYATEAAIASLGYAFADAGLDRVYSFTWTENLASLRVMEKAGFELDRPIEHADLPHLLYVARAGEWSPP
jgi:[ribosomal protein S5]-alanine N-acetyltransferase